MYHRVKGKIPGWLVFGYDKIIPKKPKTDWKLVFPQTSLSISNSTTSNFLWTYYWESGMLPQQCALCEGTCQLHLIKLEYQSLYKW